MAGHPRSSLTDSKYPGAQGTPGVGVPQNLAEPSGSLPRRGRGRAPAVPGAAGSLAGRAVLQVHHRPAVPASPPCPSSHLRAQVTNSRAGARSRASPGTPRPVPRRGHRPSRTPRPPRVQRTGGKGRRGPLRLRSPAPRPSPGSEEGLRPPLAARRRLTWGRNW